MGKLNSLRTIYHEGGAVEVSVALYKFILFRTLIGDALVAATSPAFRTELAMAPRVGYWPDVRDPSSFSEKIAYRKLYTDDERFSRLADKHRVRQFVRETVGEEILTDLYWVGDDPDSIPFEELPDEFVVKSTHGSGDLVIIDEEDSVDEEEIRSTCSKWLDTEFGVDHGEYWYGHIEPQIIIEERLNDPKRAHPLDFKLFVFDGSVEVIQVDIDRFGDHGRAMYDPDSWERLNFELKIERDPDGIDKPEKLGDLIEVAEKLGDSFSFVRVDLYLLNDGQIVFGELTFSPGNGTSRFRPATWDFEIGSMWDLDPDESPSSPRSR